MQWNLEKIDGRREGRETEHRYDIEEYGKKKNGGDGMKTRRN